MLTRLFTSLQRKVHQPRLLVRGYSQIVIGEDNCNKENNRMDITKENFEEILPQFKAAIGRSKFYAFDLEMTGVQYPGCKIEYEDTLEDRYLKLKKTSEQYSPIQLGICTFEETTEPGRLLARPYTFYIFPHPKGPEESRTFGCQSNTLHFLYRNHFNFIKWVKSGIPFIRRSDSSYLKADSDRKIEVNDRNIAFFTDLKAQLSEFQLSTESTLKLSTKNSYERRIVHQEVSTVFGNGVNVNSVQNEMTIEKKPTTSETQLTSETASTELPFIQFIDILVGSKKPVVGHNCYLDLCFFYNHFIDKLPDTLSGFTNSILKLFPTILDTKYVASFHTSLKDIQGSTTIENLLEKFKNPLYQLNNFKLDIETIDKSDPSSVTENFHNAGYDAYCTGKIILDAMAHIHGTQTKPVVDFKLFDGYQNRLFLVLSPFQSLKLSGSTSVVVSQNFPIQKFMISNLKGSAKFAEFEEIFKGIAFGIKKVHWVDASRCWVEFTQPSSEGAESSEMPTGDFSKIWFEGLLKKPTSPHYLETFGDANIISWSQWYQSTIPPKLEYPAEPVESEEESESSEEESESEESEYEESEADETDQPEIPQDATPKKEPASRPSPSAEDPPAKRPRLDHDSIPDPATS